MNNTKTNNIIRFIIVEDTRVDELTLRSLTDESASLKYITTARDAAEAISLIKSTSPDLVFMDIDIPGGSGIELTRHLKDAIPMIVFITSHGEYALEGFELSAIDYLLKPYTEDRFAQTLRRIGEYWQMKQQSIAYELLVEKETLFIKEGYNKIRLQLHEIIYLEAMQDYTKVVTDAQKYMVNMPLSGFLVHVPPGNFIRIHRSYAVLINKIKELHGSEVIITPGTILPIGKTYRSTLEQQLSLQ